MKGDNGENQYQDAVPLKGSFPSLQSLPQRIILTDLLFLLKRGLNELTVPK